MTKRMEQSRRHGHHDPRYLHQLRVLVSQDLPAEPDILPKDFEVFIGPANLRLLPQPAPLGTEERVQL
jgi:hypothetical protein